MKRRAAYSLVEMLVVMTTGTMVLGVAVGTITALLRTGEHSRRHVLERAAICRLADQFRRDVHAARQFKPLDAGQQAAPGWQLQLAFGETVEYRAARGGVERTEGPVGKVRSRESYALSAQVAVSMKLDESISPPLVCLGFAAAGQEPVPATVRAIRVEAVLGKDGRLGPVEQ